MISSILIPTFLVCLLASLLGCTSVQPPASNPLTERPAAHSTGRSINYPIRYALTFDDGPSITKPYNPTVHILETLAENAIQPRIKAIFFVQTRAAQSGGTEEGRAVMQREHAEGHLLGFHTATSRHVSHLKLAPEELDVSLNNGMTDIKSITGHVPMFVRPPFWAYDQRTFSAYQAKGLNMVLTDLSANDGKVIGVQNSPRRRSHLKMQLEEVGNKIRSGALPVVNGEIPVIVTFHDLNNFTATHMEGYLKILKEIASELDMPTATKPFYDNRDELEQAVSARAIADASFVMDLPGLGTWLRKEFEEVF